MLDGAVAVAVTVARKVAGLTLVVRRAEIGVLIRLVLSFPSGQSSLKWTSGVLS